MGAYNYQQSHKNPAKVYWGVAVPAANAEITLGADGVPDATENPAAKLMGLSDAGATATITKNVTEEFVDEYKSAIETVVEQSGMILKFGAVQIVDEDVMEAALTGMGTKQTVTGKKKFKIGSAAIVKKGVVAISPLKADPTKFLVTHAYEAANSAPFDIQMSGANRTIINLEFAASAVAGRATDDAMGAIWWNT